MKTRIKLKLLFSLLLLICSTFGWAQLKLKDIPFKISAINKKNEQGKQGVWYSYSPQDSVISNMQHFRNDTLHGYYEIYWPTGKILQKGYFKNGLLDSFAIAYWEDGMTMRQFEFYSKGKLNGISRTYNRNGSLSEIHRYIDDILDPTFDEAMAQSAGSTDTIITNDKVYTIYTLMRNRQIVKEYYYIPPSLDIFMEEFFENGMHVKRITYNMKGTHFIEKVEYFKDGEKYRTEYFDINGKKTGEKIEKE